MEPASEPDPDPASMDFLTDQPAGHSTPEILQYVQESIDITEKSQARPAKRRLIVDSEAPIESNLACPEQLHLQSSMVKTEELPNILSADEGILYHSVIEKFEPSEDILMISKTEYTEDDLMAIPTENVFHESMTTEILSAIDKMVAAGQQPAINLQETGLVREGPIDMITELETVQTTPVFTETQLQTVPLITIETQATHPMINTQPTVDENTHAIQNVMTPTVSEKQDTINALMIATDVLSTGASTTETRNQSGMINQTSTAQSGMVTQTSIAQSGMVNQTSTTKRSDMATQTSPTKQTGTVTQTSTTNQSGMTTQSRPACSGVRTQSKSTTEKSDSRSSPSQIKLISETMPKSPDIPPFVVDDLPHNDWVMRRKELFDRIGHEIPYTRPYSSGILIKPRNKKDYKTTKQYLMELITVAPTVQWHTYTLHDPRQTRLVLDGLPYDTLSTDIYLNMYRMGFPIEEVVQIEETYSGQVKGQNKRNGRFMITMGLLSSTKWAKLRDFYKVMPGAKISTWRAPTGPVLCRRCLMYGHLTENCYRIPRCNNCTVKHFTSKCPRPYSPFKCVNCRGSHRASSGLCEIYKQENFRILLSTQQFI